jgi:hypothetical protein
LYVDGGEYGRSDWPVREFMWSGKISYIRAGKEIYLDIQDLDEFIQKH